MLLKGRNILLIIGGGIAAFRALELIRRLREKGAGVRCILTEGGAEFITALSVAGLSGEKVYTDLFSLTDEAEMGHIRLSREADLVVVAPATANLMARMLAGVADDLATTALLATDKPVMICPSMNVEMWDKPATRRNVAALEADGVICVGPDDGMLACGEEGAGRLASVDRMVAEIPALIGEGARPLDGTRALVTAGPTLEAIDPVRFIANRSSGKQGYAIAEALGRLGAETILVSGPTALKTPRHVTRIDVESAEDMLAAAEDALPVDVAVCVAAVADWRPESVTASKIKKSGAPPALKLVQNPDILAAISAPSNKRPRLVVGFAAETEDVVAGAQAKLAAKGCDWIVANDVSPDESGEVVFGSDRNSVHLVSAERVETWERAEKSVIADRLARYISRELTNTAV